MKRTIRVAILDMSCGEPSRGVPSIYARLREVQESLRSQNLLGSENFQIQNFGVRHLSQVPPLADFDLFIGSGGPGDPHDGQGTSWEQELKQWLNNLLKHNLQVDPSQRKHFFGICHTFQVLCRICDLGEVRMAPRRSRGIVRLSVTEDAYKDSLFSAFSKRDFYALDNRLWEVRANPTRFSEMGAKILATYDEVPHQNALAAFRLSDEVVAVQFHPEAKSHTTSELFHSENEWRIELESLVGSSEIEKMIKFLPKIDITSELLFKTFVEQTASLILKG